MINISVHQLTEEKKRKFWASGETLQSLLPRCPSKGYFEQQDWTTNCKSDQGFSYTRRRPQTGTFFGQLTTRLFRLSKIYKKKTFEDRALVLMDIHLTNWQHMLLDNSNRKKVLEFVLSQRTPYRGRQLWTKTWSSSHTIRYHQHL